MSRLVCLLLLLFVATANAAQPSSDIILNRAFVAAMNESKKGVVDFNVYEKVINNKLQNYSDSIQIDEISVEKNKFLIFREKSKAGALFIADMDGKIIYKQEEWGISHEVVYPFEKKTNFFGITRKEPMDSPGEHKEYMYVFEANKKSAVKVLMYLNATEYCIMNPLLPKEVRDAIDGKYYTACKGKAVVKKFDPKEVEVQYTYKLEKDFLSDEQFKKVLKQYAFSETSGESVFNWTFKRKESLKPYALTRGRNIHPITGENTAVPNTQKF